MSYAILDIPANEADKKIIKIMYRREVATAQEIEESLRRSVDSFGKSVAKILNSSLGRLVRNGNLKKARGSKFKFMNGRMQ